MIISGAAHMFGDNIDTDMMLPGTYLAVSDPKEIAKHVFERVDPTFVSRFKRGDVIVAGRNFGLGSSREHAPIGLHELGVGCVVATSFARIFYRNAINIGLPIVTCPPAVRAAKPGSEVEIDTDTGRIKIDGAEFSASPFPPFLLDLMKSGGLVSWTKAELARRVGSAQAK